MSIQLFIPKFHVDECLDGIKECLEKGWTGLGFKTLEIEKDWCNYTHFNHAHFINSATSGLHLALEVYKRENNWQHDDEVITTSLTFISTNHAILYAGLTPVFADINNTLCLDPSSVLSCITEKTKALIFVGIGGNMGQYEDIRKICSQKGIIFILDAAHMAGSKHMDKQIGTDADVSVFSFQAVKNLPTADAGMICFKSKEHDEYVRKLTWLGINKDTYARTVSQGSYKWMYDVEELGYKYHGNSIMAAIAIVQLKYLDQENSYRRSISTHYRERLQDLDWLEFINITNINETSNHLFQIRCQDRDALMTYLNNNDVFPGVHYRDNKLYKMYSSFKGDCPNSLKASSEIISLPVHQNLSLNDVEAVCILLNNYKQK
ncbi:MAG: DegT/DnrJ/EryC1/StrS family aminotransferase [Mariprofundaceae bacterium]|nr:DegT/DnrJ/EryC1/StrS family aminotransferase [Mariprofundaceae bacterium]